MVKVKVALKDFPSSPVVKNSPFPMWGVLVRSLIGELIAHIPCGMAKKKKGKKKNQLLSGSFRI